MSTAHFITHYSTARRGVWCECSCGWISRRWKTVGGSELEFGSHLLETNQTAGKEDSDG